MYLSLKQTPYFLDAVYISVRKPWDTNRNRVKQGQNNTLKKTKIRKNSQKNVYEYNLIPQILLTTYSLFLSIAEIWILIQVQCVHFYVKNI